MADNNTQICRICLTDSRDDNISDSSYYAKFFIELISLKAFNEKLFLCMWCKAALRRAMAVLTLASENILHKNATDIPIKTKSLHTLRYIHNSHIDIPPCVPIEYQDYKTDDIVVGSEEITNPLKNNDNDEIKQNDETQNNDEILIKNVSVKSADISNKELFSNKIEHEFAGNSIAAKKLKKKEIDFNKFKFEVRYLNLEEQMKDMEFKKLKYKDFYFQCIECGVGFVSSDVFEQHKNRHSESSGPHSCTICSLHFKSQECLSQHTLTHRRRFKCLLCDSEFTRWTHCVAHRYKCGGEVQLVACAECAKICSNEYTLKIHMKVHNIVKKYCCMQCDRKFGSKQRLTVHMRSHSGERPFSCQECARSFATRSNLRAHSAVHDHSTKFYCVECHTYYKTAKSLKRHFNESLKHVALKNDIFPCKDCIKQFPNEASLNRHLNTRHGTLHRCNQCDKVNVHTFSSNSNLNKHIKCIHAAK